MSRVAITRRVGASLDACTLTHLERAPIDASAAALQHEAFEVTLRGLGFTVDSQPALDSLPDSVFIEDTAVILKELAVITRPGAATRRPEVPHTTRALAPYRRLVFIDAPGTIEGGDVLRLGKRLLVGLSARTNQEGVRQLRAIVEPLGYTVETLEIQGALHLKSACTRIAGDTVLANPDWIDTAQIGVERVINVAPSEPFAANVLSLGGRVIVSSAYPETRTILRRAGCHTIAVDVTELHKAEGGLTCLTLVL